MPKEKVNTELCKKCGFRGTPLCTYPDGYYQDELAGLNKMMDNPLVAVTFWFQDGSGLRQVFDNLVPQARAMAGLGRLVAELGGYLRLEIEHEEAKQKTT